MGLVFFRYCRCLAGAVLLLISCSSQGANPLAICAIFKNEAPWLKEWVQYHHKILGINHFYLYNNDSNDGYQTVLQPFIEQGIVELIPWSSSDPTHLAYGPFMDAPWSAAQLGAYNDCLKRALHIDKWVAMIDIDEFIVPTKGKECLYATLKRAEKKKRGCVSFHWKVFGTSDVEELSSNELLIEKLLYRAHDCHPWHAQVKSIYRPEGVAFCLVHAAEKMNPHYGSMTVEPDEITIHHYWTRTKKSCLEKRQNPSCANEFNAVLDPVMIQYAERLKKLCD